MTAATADENRRDNHCEFFLLKKRRYCANARLSNSKFCGNHNPTSNSRRVPCPIDPSHSVFAENMDAHVKKCPLKKQMESLESKSYYSKGINREVGGLIEGGNVSSEVKRKVIYEMNVGEFNELVRKIKDAYISLRVDLKESFLEPDACKKWIDQQVNRKVPYELKHVMQQVSIIGNMENFGILKKPKESSIIELHDCVSPAVVEFGAGRGYLTHMLADCYEMKKIYLVERRSYKLKIEVCVNWRI